MMYNQETHLFIEVESKKNYINIELFNMLKKHQKFNIFFRYVKKQRNIKL